MKVEELIELLKKCKPQATVYSCILGKLNSKIEHVVETDKLLGKDVNAVLLTPDDRHHGKEVTL